MTGYDQLQSTLRSSPRSWLVTGGAGFIGSHVTEALLALGQRVRVLDDFSFGHRRNLELAEPAGHHLLEIIERSVADSGACARAAAGMDHVVHLAALGSVPLSLEKAELCHASNTTGTLNVFMAARDAGIRGVAYASSSAVYGDDALPCKREDSLGRCLSPYAASKRINEIHAQTWHTCFGLRAVGLRFFNVFGPRQDPNGAYAAVIPQWISAMKQGRDVFINGDGANTRDFCFVRDVVQALLLAATTENASAAGDVFNVGLGSGTSLNELFATLKKLVEDSTGRSVAPAIHREFRPGDIRHSCADASKIQRVLGFAPRHSVMAGLRETIAAF
jgi:UDP-N-acetylglucosamine/UDP-N-acetylgalactosamine 4-epimerase